MRFLLCIFFRSPFPLSGMETSTPFFVFLHNLHSAGELTVHLCIRAACCVRSFCIFHFRCRDFLRHFASGCVSCHFHFPAAPRASRHLCRQQEACVPFSAITVSRLPAGSSDTVQAIPHQLRCSFYRTAVSAPLHVPTRLLPASVRWRGRPLASLLLFTTAVAPHLVHHLPLHHLHFSFSLVRAVPGPRAALSAEEVDRTLRIAHAAYCLFCPRRYAAHFATAAMRMPISVCSRSDGGCTALHHTLHFLSQAPQGRGVYLTAISLFTTTTLTFSCSHEYK
jgi:hypothetical protein